MQKRSDSELQIQQRIMDFNTRFGSVREFAMKKQYKLWEQRRRLDFRLGFDVAITACSSDIFRKENEITQLKNKLAEIQMAFDTADGLDTLEEEIGKILND